MNGYPAQWAYSRLNMLFKKGVYMNCDNYRGISVINCISKIYDYVLYNRLSKWFTPHKEQAGAQPKRGCIEHILSLRLIIKVCRKKKWKLFVTYVDFSKAYDRVPRNKLLHTMKRLGCGFMMLFAIAAMYKVTKSIIGIAIVTAIIGVRQGSPTSCFLFNLFVDTLITSLCNHVTFYGLASPRLLHSPIDHIKTFHSFKHRYNNGRWVVLYALLSPQWPHALFCGRVRTILFPTSKLCPCVNKLGGSM